MSPPITAPGSTKAGTVSAGEMPPDLNPSRPSPAHLGEIYTGTYWEPTSELDLSQRTAPSVEYTGSTEKFEPRVHISRWQQLKNTSKFSLAVMIALSLLLIGIFTVIGLMSEDIIKIPDRNETTSAKKQPLVNREFAVLPVDTLANVPPMETSTSSEFTQLPPSVPDFLEAKIASESLALTPLATLQTASSAEVSPVSVPMSTFVTRASTS